MQFFFRKRAIRRVAVLLSAALAVPIALSLAACSNVPEPEENIDSLTAVTEAPAPPKAAEEYDIELHPDPIADPIDCTPYLVITARGTGEPNKGQLLSPVARTIKKALPDEVTVLNLDYPADTDVNEGGTYGVRLLLDTLNVQAKACPAQVFVLLGYSQGALIVGDALSAPDSRIVGSTVGELTDDAASRIAAIVLYGNPRFSATESYDEGTFNELLGGILPRTAGTLDAFADRIRDYCVAKDFICQSSLDLDEKGHVAYFKNGMQEKGAEFVLSRLVPLKGTQLIPTPGDDAQAPAGEGSTPTPAQ